MTYFHSSLNIISCLIPVMFFMKRLTPEKDDGSVVSKAGTDPTIFNNLWPISKLPFNDRWLHHSSGFWFILLDLILPFVTVRHNLLLNRLTFIADFPLDELNSLSANLIQLKSFTSQSFQVCLRALVWHPCFFICVLGDNITTANFTVSQMTPNYILTRKGAKTSVAHIINRTPSTHQITSSLQQLHFFLVSDSTLHPA